MNPLSRIPPRVNVLIGLGLCFLAVFLMQQWGTLAGIQQASSAEQFATRAYDGGNSLRLSSLADAFLYVPGYVVLFLGLLARHEHTVADWATKLLIGGAVADQIENVSLQLAMGTVDLDAAGTAGVVAPAGWLLAIIRMAGGFKFLCLALAIIGVFAVMVRASRARVNEISRNMA